MPTRRTCLRVEFFLYAVGMGTPHVPVAIKLVIVTMFDPPAGPDNWPSELTRWVEHVPLPERLEFPLGERELRLNRERGVLAVVTGVGNTKAATTMTALGLDPRFDLSRSYWLVAGIAGADPDAMTLGSAVWADWVVDGDLAHDIDPREMPPDWPTGRVPLGKSAPYQPPPSTLTTTMAWRLNPALVDCAYRLTRDVASPDGATVLTGAVLASNSLWHGALLNRWAVAWVKYWTREQGRFVAAAMEDVGIVSSLHALARTGRVQAERLLILRTASNYVVPPSGVSAAQSLADEMRKGFSAHDLALEAAYRVGVVVMEELICHWEKYG
jgi:purine nucleoside permease